MIFINTFQRIISITYFKIHSFLFRNLLENTIQPLSDAPEQILKNVGHMQLRITHDKQDVINTFDIEANKFLPGANYQILVQSPDQKGPLGEDGKPTNILRTSIFHKITDENSVHIFWLLPQFVSDDIFLIFKWI